MMRAARRVLGKYGEELTAVRNGDRTGFYGILQPITTRSLQQMMRKFGTIGEKVRGRFLLLTAEDVREAEYVVKDGNAYLLRCAERIGFCPESAVYWALLEPVGKEQTWTNL